MIRAGLTRWHIGRTISWADFRDFLLWLPPTGESAWYRARKPQSWWVTPELQIQAAVLHAVEGGNWQRGGGQGTQPKPMQFPEDRELSGPKTAKELASRREQLRRRRST